VSSRKDGSKATDGRITVAFAAVAGESDRGRRKHENRGIPPAPPFEAETVRAGERRWRDKGYCQRELSPRHCRILARHSTYECLPTRGALSGAVSDSAVTATVSDSGASLGASKTADSACCAESGSRRRCGDGDIHRRKAITV
jgi:hypothetical protein